MATDAQNEANRENAQRSTGPRTEEGRNRSRFNAVKHGLAADHLLILDENHAEFELLRDELLDELAAVGPKEHELAHMILADLWRLRRQRRIEAGILTTHRCKVEIADAYEAAKAAGIREQNLASAQYAPSPSPDRVEAFQRIHKFTELQRDPTALLGRAYEHDVSGSSALDRNSRYEGTLRNRLERTLRLFEHLQAQRLNAERKANDEESADD